MASSSSSESSSSLESSSSTESSSDSDPEPELEFVPGNLIGGQWEVMRIHCEEPFFHRYAVRNRNTAELAMCEVESANADQPLLHYNQLISRELADLHLGSISPFIDYCPMYFDVNLPGEYRYLVTAPVGPSILHLRQALPAIAQRRFSLFTCLQIGRESLLALKEFHEAGYLHRDVKSGVFSLKRVPLFILVLSINLPRRWLNFDGNGPLPSRGIVNFRGNVRCASINSLSNREQSRFDDLWSWFYVIVDLTMGSLPWGLNVETSLPGESMRERRQRIAREKESAHDNAQWLQSAPSEYKTIFEYLKSAAPQDDPDYNRIVQLVTNAVDRISQEERILDWEPRGRYRDALQHLL